MYGVHDHPEISASSTLDLDSGFPRFSQESYQLSFLEQDRPLLPGGRLLDFACGNGFYLASARRLGFEVMGVEYDARLAEAVRQRTGLDVRSHAEFRESYRGPRFDVVHLGHVLEHVPSPPDLLRELQAHAHARTVFVVDGPLEYNACLSRWVINLGSRLKAKSHNDQAPQHLSLTTYSSQKRFFETRGFKTLRYEAVEQFWPLPDKPEWRSPSLLARYALGRVSIALSERVAPLGNLFHYVGTGAGLA